MSDPEAKNSSIAGAASPATGEEPVEQVWEEENLSDAEQDALMEEYLSNLKTVREGEIRAAKVVAISSEGVLVNLDGKSEGFAPLREFQDASGELEVAVGDEVKVLIEERDGDSGQVEVSYKVAKKMLALDTLQGALDGDLQVSGKVVAAVKSGLLVDCGIECFMPASHIDLARVEKLEDWVGKTIEVHVLELNQRRGRAVVSRRKHLEALRAVKRAELMAKVHEGDIVQGTVTNVLGFGAFIDLDGVEAFIPREEVSWERAASPVDYLRPGNAVEAKIMKLNAETGKITLSRKQMSEDPWQSVNLRFQKGGKIEGEVTGLTKFGAFIRIEEGLTGLIHVSDLSWSSAPVQSADCLKEGDRVEALILDIDSERQRLSLGLKQISEDPWLEVEGKYAPGSKVKGVISGITRFGAFVRLDENIEGLIHISDFSWDKKPAAISKSVKTGDEVEALVLKTDKTARRISLGLKQMTPSPLEQFAKEHKKGQSIDGKVISIIDSGAFLELAPGIDGFLPISHMSEEKINKVESVCKVGDTLNVKIMRLDTGANRISLSLKQRLKDEERAQIKSYMSDNEAKGGQNLGELLQNLSLPDSN